MEGGDSGVWTPFACTCLVQLLFGVFAASVEVVADQVSRRLGITFELRDGLWHGGDYFIYEAESEQIIVQTNNDGGPPDEPAEEQFPQFPILIYVTTQRREEMLTQLGRCDSHPQLLRSDSVS